MKMMKDRLKKISAVSFAAIYLQVNCGWAGSPTLPLPADTSRLFFPLYYRVFNQRWVPKFLRPGIRPDFKNQVFVFHWNQAEQEELQREAEQAQHGQQARAGVEIFEPEQPRLPMPAEGIQP